MKKTCIFVVLILIAALGRAEKLVTLTDIMKPTFFVSGEDRFYVVETSKVHIYSLKDYKLKKTFGKAGEGPQEFRPAPFGPGIIISPLKDSLLITSMGRVSHYTRDGEFIKMFNTGMMQFSFYQEIGDGLVGLGGDAERDGRTFYLTLNIYDKELKKTKELHRQKTFDRGSFEFPQTQTVPHASGDRVFLPAESGFKIYEFDTAGNRKVLIDREYDPVKMTDTFKEGVLEFFKTNPYTAPQYETFKNMIKFKSHFPVIQHMTGDGDKLYILTFLQEREKYETFVYDSRGKFLKRVFLPYHQENPFSIAPFDFKNNRFYYLPFNEDTEEWELHAMTIE